MFLKVTFKIKNKTRISIVTTSVHTTLVEVPSNIVFANDMIVYRKYHRTGTKKLLEAISGIQQGHAIQVSIQKSYFYVLAPNNWKVKFLKVQFTVPSKTSNV